MFALFLVDRLEELMLSGPGVMMDEAGVAMISISSGMGAIYRINQAHHKSMNNCSLDNVKASSCLEAVMKEKSVPFFLCSSTYPTYYLHAF